MSLRKLSIIISFTAVLLFSLLQFVPFFRNGDNFIFDLFLRLKPRRSHIDNVVFLNVDDAAIAAYGVFPLPRSVYADGLLRLKEYGAKLAIFDIEFIDKSPTKVDEVYLKEGLQRDYKHHFDEISKTIEYYLNQISRGDMPAEEAAYRITDIRELINDERDALYAETMRIASDDDILLANAAALFGNTWGTLNLQEEALSGEQAERRHFAEEKFSYPIKNLGGMPEGKNADVLTANMLFSQSVNGAGFTNINPDPDGVRRRIFLAQEVDGKWYLQLAFAPLMDSWGRPEITIKPGTLAIEGRFGKTVIPLDAEGNMLLDWPREDYYRSYDHISFAHFYTLDGFLKQIEMYLLELENADESLFPEITKNVGVLLEYYRLMQEKKRSAMEECSEEIYNEYITIKKECLEQTGEFVNYLLINNYIENTEEKMMSIYDDDDIIHYISEEAEYCQSLLEYINMALDSYLEYNDIIFKKLNNRYCIFGRTDTGTTDINVNPFHAKYINVGTHGVVLDTILTKSFITPLSVLYSVIFTFLFVPLILISISGLKPNIRYILGFTGIAVSFFLPLLIFVLFKIFLAPLSTMLATAVSVIVRESIAFVTSEKEKRFIRRAFSTYLSAGVVEEIIADPSKLNLGGEKREMTVIFTDIKSFSSISESLDPAQLVRMLNRYLTVMSNIIMDNHGTIDKYEGDAIIAFFGAPLYREDHALLACRSALVMKEAEDDLNKELILEGLSPSPIFTRIGINTGDMVVGNMGTDNKMDYTVMGHSVNLASRLEGVNKQYQTGIIVSEFTKKQAGENFLYRQLDKVRVLGINTPVLLYELFGTMDKTNQIIININNLWKNAMDCYEQQLFSKAADLFTSILTQNPNDKAADIFLQRCISFINNKFDPNWDGIINLTEK